MPFLKSGMSTSLDPSRAGVAAPSALLDLDKDLLSDVRDLKRRRLALEAVIADELWLDSGDRLDVAAIAPGQGLGVLIMSGFICREVAVAERVSADLAGPEDLLSLAPIALADDVFPATVSFVALGPVRLAVLDNAFCARVAPWPEILRVLVERARRPGDRSAHVRAIARSAGIEVRLLLSLWYWASWWSSVLPDGLRLAVPLSHERLAHLLGATRPTITTAVGRLRRAGYVAQPAEGVWLLRDSSNVTAAIGDGELPLDPARVRLPPQFSPAAKVRSPWDLLTATRSDVYARLAAQRGELDRATALVESMLASLGIGVAVVDHELRIQMWNDRARDLWGADIDQVRGKHLLNLDIGLPVGELRDQLRASIAGATTDEKVLKGRDRRGRDVTCRVNTAPLADVSGAIAGTIVMMRVDEPSDGSRAR